VNETFVAILRRHLRYLPPDEELAPDAPLRALGLDSMAAVALMLDLEDEFATVLPDERLSGATFATARSLWSAIVSAG
jgi:acyl carrier protein